MYVTILEISLSYGYQDLDDIPNSEQMGIKILHDIFFYMYYDTCTYTCTCMYAGLNRLQSGQHKQYMKDLFVELCLTVPVRLSVLLPYLHMLMHPLVSALNGSKTLISQGLRTLELCVDNLQPDFLYDHIQVCVHDNDIDKFCSNTLAEVKVLMY